MKPFLVRPIEDFAELVSSDDVVNDINAARQSLGVYDSIVNLTTSQLIRDIDAKRINEILTAAGERVRIGRCTGPACRPKTLRRPFLRWTETWHKMCVECTKKAPTQRDDEVESQCLFALDE